MKLPRTTGEKVIKTLKKTVFRWLVSGAAIIIFIMQNVAQSSPFPSIPGRFLLQRHSRQLFHRPVYLRTIFGNFFKIFLQSCRFLQDRPGRVHFSLEWLRDLVNFLRSQFVISGFEPCTLNFRERRNSYGSLFIV